MQLHQRARSRCEWLLEAKSIPWGKLGETTYLLCVHVDQEVEKLPERWLVTYNTKWLHDRLGRESRPTSWSLSLAMCGDSPYATS